MKTFIDEAGASVKTLHLERKYKIGEGVVFQIVCPSPTAWVDVRIMEKLIPSRLPSRTTVQRVGVPPIPFIWRANCFAEGARRAGLVAVAVYTSVTENVLGIVTTGLLLERPTPQGPRDI